MISAYINWVVGRPWTVIIISMILVAISGIGMSKLAFRTDHRLFFAEDNPELLNFVEVEKTYTKNDNILFVVTAKNGNIFDRETMEVLLDLTAEGWTLPRVRRVDSITNFQNSRAEGDDIAIDNLVLRKADLTPEYLGEIRQTVLNEPLLVNRLVAPKGDVAGVVATFEIEDHEKDEVVHAIVDKARAYQARLKRDAPGVELRLSGSVMMDNAFAEASASDMSTLLPLMIVIIIVLSGVLLRSAAGAALTLVVVLCSVVVAMGLAGFIGIPLSPPSSVAPSIILTLATAECVHIVWSCVRAMHLGLCRRDAVAAALKANFRPLFLTASTTVVGFLTMNSAEAPPFIHLGNITAIGVTASYLLTISFLPAALTKVRMEKSSEEPPFIARISHWCSGLVRRHATGLAWGGLALTLTISSAAFLNKFDDRFVEYFDRSIEFRRDTDYVNDRLTGIYYIDYSLEAGAEHGVNDPIYLRGC
jgi:predicted RND superfamily exporter protein